MAEYKPLPRQAQELCRAVGAPPRLIAHLILVHDCACRLMTEIRKQFPNLQMDEEAILFGAATHDMARQSMEKNFLRRDESIEPKEETFSKRSE
jgi:HD superfamily phosphohydrolase YqeK